MSRCADLSVIVERPTDIKRLMDFMLGASPEAFKIDPECIGFFGFSRGGYTGLVLVGVNPDWATATEFCQLAERPIRPPIRRKEFLMQPFVHDPRIKAAVIADPGPVFFSTRTSLAAISVPLQLSASARGNPFVTPESVAAADRNLPAKHEYHVVRNSRHDDFFLCPPALGKDPECTMRRASTASPSASGSTRMCSRSSGHTWHTYRDNDHPDRAPTGVSIMT